MTTNWRVEADIVDAGGVEMPVSFTVQAGDEDPEAAKAAFRRLADDLDWEVIAFGDIKLLGEKH